MKKYFVIALLIPLCFCLLFPFAKSERTDSENTFTLPASLECIGDDAFEGVNVKNLYVSDSVKSISDTAFDEENSMTVHGSKGSYAEDWAREQGYVFVDIELVFLVLDGVRIPEYTVQWFDWVALTGSVLVLLMRMSMKRNKNGLFVEFRREIHVLELDFP